MLELQVSLLKQVVNCYCKVGLCDRDSTALVLLPNLQELPDVSLLHCIFFFF